ncbi:MAG: hypothetical protein ABI433_00675 [Burkholderiaceae bacterium]
MTRSTPASKTSAALTPVKSTKTATAAKSKPAAKKAQPTAAPPVVLPPVVAVKPKNKLVRDSFTIPKSEYMVLEALKLRAGKLERPTKKSEVLRAGIGALNAMSDKAFLAALLAIPSIKTGRPKNPPKSES